MTTEYRVRMLAYHVAGFDLDEDLFVDFVLGLGGNQACRLRRAIERLKPTLDRHDDGRDERRAGR